MQNPKLNILIYPMFSVDNINADSNYIIIKQLCNELAKTNKYNFLLILDKNRRYIKDDLSPSVKVIQMPFPRNKRQQVTHFNTNVLREIFKKYAIDVIWNNVVEQGHHFKYFIDTLDADLRVKVFNYHHYVIHRSLERLTNYEPCRHIMLDQIIGSMCADVNYFHTKHCYNMLIEEAEDILLPKEVEKIKEKSIVDIGGYCNEIKSTKKYDKFTFIYNHRLDGYKNWKDTFAVWDRLWEEGEKFQVIITAGDRSNISVAESKPYTEVKSFSLHSDYLVELSKCHANVINSRHETFCISIVESIMNDQVIVAPNRVTFPELVDKDYPYLFETNEEQYNMLKDILKNNIRSYDYKEKKKLLLETHSKKIDKYFQNLIKLSDYYKKGNVIDRIKKDKTKEEIKKYLNNRTIVDLNEFRKFICSLGYGNQAFPQNKIKRILNELGFDYNIHLNKYCK